ncbi:MAG: hypothetical protein K6T65_09810 [Peptococcaceae bacterium]|nr:hypothetical protein [Peptococcaceae bacterium]
MEKQQDFEEICSDIKIGYLVYAANDFIVFLDSDLDVDWKTSDEYDKRGHHDLDRHNAILNRAASLECIPNHHQKREIRLNFKRMVAEGVARSLKHDYKNAENILDEAERYIRNRNIETARIWQLSSSCICCFASVIIALTLWGFRDILIPYLGSTAFYLTIGALSGSIGATLSIIHRMGKSDITSEADKKLHILEAVSRNIGGAIFGLLVSMLIQIGIVVPMFASTGMTNIAMVAGGLIAGASERWAPSLISQFEKTTLEERGIAN